MKTEVDIKSFTLRLPETLRRKVAVEADQMGKSLNEHIQSILETHTLETGYGQTGLISPSGRKLQIDFAADDIKGRPYLMGFFYVKEPKFNNKIRANYMLGVSRDIEDDWQICRNKDAIMELGIALLNFYNRTMEVDCLSWEHPVPNQDFDGYRVFGHSDLKACSMREFLDKLRQGRWSDPKLIVQHQSQDLRSKRLTESDLYRY